MSARDEKRPPGSIGGGAAVEGRGSSRATIRTGFTPPPESGSRRTPVEAHHSGLKSTKEEGGVFSSDAPVPTWFETRAPKGELGGDHRSQSSRTSREWRGSSRPTERPESDIGGSCPTGEGAEELFIPPAPRLPQLDPPPHLERASDSTRAWQSLSDETAPPSQRAEGLGSVFPSRTIRSPAPAPRYSSIPQSFPGTSRVVRQERERQSSTLPASSRSALEEADPTSLYFAPHLRLQANKWLETGALSLPGSSSPRHSRALQRALLLSMLQAPGWELLPLGLRQRSGWLFSEGWGESVGLTHPHREIDDLAMVLGYSRNGETRELLERAILSLLPPPAS